MHIDPHALHAATDLLGMKIWSLTFERAEELRRQKADNEIEVEKLDATSPKRIWLNDLDAIEELLDERDKTVGVTAKNKKRSKPESKSIAAKKKSSNRHDEVSSTFNHIA